MSGRTVVHLLLIVIVLQFSLPNPSWSEKGQDHPLVKRYPGSEIRKYIQKEFDEVLLPLGKAEKKNFENSRIIQGKVTAIDYKYPKGRSTVEVYKNYEEGLLKAGFEVLYQCGDTACGKGGPADMHLKYRWTCFEQRHLSAKLPRDEGDIYINLHVCKGVDRAYVTVIESKPMEMGLVEVDADALLNDIERSGHASIYGVYFDTGKSEVKPESKQALGEIAKLLDNKPDLKLYIVGHTDNVGKLDYNKNLSIRRAVEVEKVLSEEYNIDPGRLHPEGVGPLAPILSNTTDSGRAKNRRVELVAQ